MIRRWFLERFPHAKNVAAWWQISQTACEDGYVRGVRQTQPANPDKLRLKKDKPHVVPMRRSA